ncbi:MAG: two component transcriptional regulator, winged helix family [Solirubrobacterales bacterium]|jgi:DNA-binding response OmpR family regulator|nr:two component transcriptional regulator, winged helix family [Solirubrobacterales bacterium]
MTRATLELATPPSSLPCPDPGACPSGGVELGPCAGEDRLAQRPILVVESDGEMGRGIVAQLAADGYLSKLALTAEHARVLAAAAAPRLAVLGQVDGPHGALRLLTEIRQPRSRCMMWDSTVPAIVVGDLAHELDVLRAFETGADDFLARPASYLELRARLRAVLRRSEVHPLARRRLEIGELTIDSRARSVSLHGWPVTLRRLEFELLCHLARDPRRVFAKSELLLAIWGYACGDSTRTLDSHASRLRRKLSLHGEGRWVVNVRGVGYRLT